MAKRTKSRALARRNKNRTKGKNYAWLSNAANVMWKGAQTSTCASALTTQRAARADLGMRREMGADLHIGGGMAASGARHPRGTRTGARDVSHLDLVTADETKVAAESTFLPGCGRLDMVEALPREEPLLR